MSITITVLSDIIRQRYNAVGDSFFSDQYLFDLIWQAESVLAKEGYVIQNTYTTTSTAATRELAYPSNTLAIREVRYKYSKLVKVPLVDDPKIDTTEPSGTPTHYGIWDDVIILFPTPDTSADTIQVRVYEYPQRLTATSALNVPTEYQIDLADFVLAEMSLKDGNIALQREYVGKWEQTVQRARDQRQIREQADKTSVVRDTYFCADYGVKYGF
jgi:hypothetical protein